MSLVGLSLLNATTAGPGVPLIPDSPKSIDSVGMQVDVQGSPSSFEIDIEITIDGTNWVSVLQNTNRSNGILAPYATTPPSGGIFTQVRANLVSLVGGSSPTVTATIAIAD